MHPAGMRNKAGVCMPVANVKTPGGGTALPRHPGGTIGSGTGSLEGGTPSTADGGHSFPYYEDLAGAGSSGEEDPKETPQAGTKRRTGVPPKKKKTTGTKGKGTPPRPVPKKKAPGKGRVPKPKAKPKPRLKAKHPRHKQNARPKRKHLPMRQVDAQSVTKRARRGRRMQGEPGVHAA